MISTTKWFLFRLMALALLATCTSLASSAVFLVQGELTDKSKKSSSGRHYATHKQQLSAGTKYTIDVSSMEFGVVASLLSPDGLKHVAIPELVDKTTVRMTFTPEKDGEYQLQVIAKEVGAKGKYQVRISSPPPMPAPTKGKLVMEVKCDMGVSGLVDPLRKGVACEAFSMRLNPLSVYTVELVDVGFDAVVRIENAEGKVIASQETKMVGKTRTASLRLMPYDHHVKTAQVGRIVVTPKTAPASGSFTLKLHTLVTS